MSLISNTGSLRNLLEVAKSLPDARPAPTGTKQITENGTYDVAQYAEANVNVKPLLQEKTVTPTTSQQSVTPDANYDGLSEVTVNGDSDLIPENIKKNTTVFGVTGTMESFAMDWDKVQQNGTRTDYRYMFAGRTITKEVLESIKYPIPHDGVTMSIRWANNLFYYRGYGERGADVVDFSKLPITFDNCTELRQTFEESDIDNITINNPSITYWYRTFTGGNGAWGYPETLTVFFPEETTYFHDVFRYTTRLKNLTLLEGSVIVLNFDIRWSPLTLESAKGVVSALKDYSGTEQANTKTVQFKDDVRNSLAADMTAPGGVSWVDYAVSKGWNI